MAATSTVALNITGNASQQLAKINKQVEGLGKSFSGLRNAIAGLALGGFIANTFRMAAAMDDLAKATGVSIAQIDSLSKALQANGGNAEDVTTLITKFSQSLDEARNGGKAAFLAFRELGIGMDQLAMSDEKVLGATLDALAKMPASAQRTALVMELLGKSLRTVDFAKLTEDQKKFLAESQKNAAARQAAADLEGKFVLAVERVRDALLKTIKPLVDYLNSIPEDKLNAMIDSFTKMAVAIAGLAGAAKVLSSIAAAFLSIKGYIALIGTGSATLALTWKILGKQIGYFTAALAAATGVFGKLKEVAIFLFTLLTKRLKFLVIGLGSIASGILALVAVIYAVREALKFAFDIDIFAPAIKAWDYMVAKAKELLGLQKKFDARNFGAREATAAESGVFFPGGEPETPPPIEDPFADMKRNILDIVDAYKQQNAEIMRSNNLETLYLGMKENEVEIQRAVTDLFDRQEEIVKRLTVERDKLGDKNAQEKAFIQQQIDLVNQQFEEEKKNIVDTITNLQKKKAELQQILHLNQMIRDNVGQAEAITQLQEELTLVGLYGEELEKQSELLNIERQLRNELQTIALDILDLKAKEATMNADEFQREIERHQERIRMAYELRDAQVTAATQSRDKRNEVEQSYSEGVRRGLEDMAKDMTPLKMGQKAVEIGFEKMNQALDDFVETGKLNFADLARSIILDITKMIAKMLIFKAIEAGLNALFPGLGTTVMAGARANGGPVGSNKPYLVGEKGPELFVPNSAGNIVPNNQLGGGQVVSAPVTNNNVVYNISAIDSKSVAQFFYENRKAMLGTVTMARKEMPYATA